MQKGYKNIRLKSERVAEFEYQPGKCKQGYRIVVLEKNLSVESEGMFGLLMPNGVRGTQVVKMEFGRFLNTLILLPCQIVRTGRKIVYRLLGYNDWLKDFFATWERIRRLKLVLV